MARRQPRAGNTLPLDRPRAKGWRGDPPQELRPLPATTGEPARRSNLAVVGRVLTAEQVSAVRAIMRLFVEDDLAKGVSPARRMRCVACADWRSAPGFIRYERLDFCNDCASAFETARLRGLVRTAAQYLESEQRKVSA